MTEDEKTWQRRRKLRDRIEMAIGNGQDCGDIIAVLITIVTWTARFWLRCTSGATGFNIAAVLLAKEWDKQEEEGKAFDDGLRQYEAYWRFGPRT